MDELLPIEIQNIVYYHRTTYNLRAICGDRCINFDKLCSFLLKYGGVLSGSAALACVTQSNKFSDLDIFIKVPDSNCYSWIYKEFFEVLTIGNEKVTVGKSPITNRNPDDKFLYRHWINYQTQTHSPVSIDITLINTDRINTIEDLFIKYSDIDISGIMFTGNDWIFPPNILNLADFIKNPTCHVINSFENGEFFDRLYIGCVKEYTTGKELFVSKYTETVHKLKGIHDLNLPADHSEVYNCIVVDPNMEIDEAINLTLERCGEYLSVNMKQMSCNTQYRILRVFFRICKYMSYGFKVNNINRLKEFTIPHIPDGSDHPGEWWYQQPRPTENDVDWIPAAMDDGWGEPLAIYVNDDVNAEW